MLKANSLKSVWHCPTFAGRSDFRVRGSLPGAVEVWGGAMPYPIRFSKELIVRMLDEFRGREVRIGMSFTGGEPGSLGKWIQNQLGEKRNPTYMIGGLLVHQGYAIRSRRGYIKFHDQYSEVEAPRRIEAEAGGRSESGFDHSSATAQAILDLRAYRSRLSLGGLKLRDLINEGRR